MTETLFARENPIYREMMTHVPLFAHRKPQHIAIHDEDCRGLAEEALKHADIATVWLVGSQEKLQDARTQSFPGTLHEFLLQADKGSIDLLIIGSTDPVDLDLCINALREDGILIQLGESPFDLPALRKTQLALKTAGFADTLPLNFPQPHFPTGWRAATMASKHGTIKRPREKDIFNKTFATGYYNLDMHKAAFALPEFMRKEFA